MLSSEHTSKQFDAELEAIRASVLEMGELVKSQVHDAVRSLSGENVALMTRVIDGDHRVNAMEVRIDEECTRVIACRQPTANDLRFVMTVVKTTTDLERIGDEAKNIARKAKAILLGYGLTRPHYNKVKRESKMALEMLSKSLDAFACLDANLALQVVGQDELVDEIYNDIMRNLITIMMEDMRTISTALELVFVAKAIERIGDHAQNIAEYVIYMVKGRDVRHITADEVEREVQQHAADNLSVAP